MRLAVLASGTGSILDAIADAGLSVDLVLADRQCMAVDRAAARGIPASVVERPTFGPGFDREAYTREVVEALVDAGIDLVAMAGFGTILGRPAYEEYGGRILNTHPALLPSFPGWHAVGDALSHGVKVTGCTVHIATLEVDSGPILAQEAVPVLPDDSVESLHERIKAVERRLYPATIRAVMEASADLVGGAA